MVDPKYSHKTVVINWDEFDKLISYQCTQQEVADFFGCDLKTLERRAIQERGESLAEIWRKKKAFGKIRLRKAQLAIVEGMGAGAASMAIYLDKKMFPDENPNILEKNPQLLAPQVKAEIFTFEQFCLNAKYFKPFPKQIEMYQFAFEAEEPRLLLGTRGYGKTDYLTIMGVAYRIYLDNQLTTLIITKSKQRNSAIVDQIAKALIANGVQLDKQNSSVIEVSGKLGKDSSVEAITIRSTLRGRHPKLILMDDPVTEEDVSPATRKLVETKYNEVMKLTSNVLIIGQPAHADDLYAKLRKRIKKLEIKHGEIPELDHDLEAQRIAGVSEASIQASYFLNILDEGQMPFSNLKSIEKMPAGEKVAFIDPSEGGDYTALCILKNHFDLLAFKGKCWKRAWYHCLDEIIPMLVEENVTRVAFEYNSTGEQPIYQLREKLSEYGIAVVGVYTTTNKHAKIMAAGSYSDKLLMCDESELEFKNQVLKYEYKAKNDDAPDSLASCLVWLGLIKI